jgi:hypothetical protein
MAAGPLVVAGHVDRGGVELVEHGLRRREDVVGASAAAVLDVAVEDGEGEVGVVHVGDQRRDLGTVVGPGVGHVAPQAEREPAG